MQCPRNPGSPSAVPRCVTQMVMSNPGLKFFSGHPPVKNIMGWPREVPRVFQQPLCSLPVLAVATVLDVGELLLYDKELRRIVPVAEGQRCMAVLVGSKQLAQIQGDDAPGGITKVQLSLPDGDDNVAAGARHTLDTLDLGPVVEVQSGGQRLVIASAQSPSQAGVDVIVEIVQDYGWRLLAGGNPFLQAVRWPRLLEYLSGELDGQPVLTPASTWDQAKQTLLSSATARALAGELLRYHEAHNDVWQDLRSQRCEGGCVASRSVLPLMCSGCGETAPVRVHQCASIPLCGSCRERAGRGWPKAL